MFAFPLLSESWNFSSEKSKGTRPSARPPARPAIVVICQGLLRPRRGRAGGSAGIVTVRNCGHSCIAN